MILNSVSSVSPVSRVTYFGNGTRMYQQNKESESAYSEMQTEKSKKISNMKRLISGADKKQTGTKSLIESTLEYGQSIRNTRKANKDTSSAIKKLKYNFKDISGQIRKSKTSVGAKQVASKARREVIRLKAQLSTGKYDEEELQAAIEHAKSMERAAKKKARHLEEEELIKVTDKEGSAVSVADFEEQMEEKIEKSYEEYEESIEAMKEEELQKLSEAQAEYMEILSDSMMDELAEVTEESFEETTEEMYDMLAESMEEMMEETMGDLAESMMVLTDYEMNEEEFKTFRLKHRASEEKSMIEADGKYLKAMFDMYKKGMASGAGTVGTQGTGYDIFQGNNVSDTLAGIFTDADMNSQVPNVVDISL